MKIKLWLVLTLGLVLFFGLLFSKFSLAEKSDPSILKISNPTILVDDSAGNMCGQYSEIELQEGDMICISGVPSQYGREFSGETMLLEYQTPDPEINYRWYIYPGNPSQTSYVVSGSEYSKFHSYNPNPPWYVSLEAPKYNFLQRVLKPNQRVWVCFKITDTYGITNYALECSSNGGNPGYLKRNGGWTYYPEGLYGYINYDYADDPRISWRTGLSGTYKGGSKQEVVVRWNDDAIGDLHLSCSIDGYADENNQCTPDSPDLWDYQDPNELDEASSSGTLTCYLNLPRDTSSHTVRCQVHDEISGWSNEIESSFNTDSTPPSGFSIDSVEGDTSSPYIDKTDDGKTVIRFHVNGASRCRWSWSDTTYSGMSNQCESTSQCTITGVNENNHEYHVFISCVDPYGNENDGNDNLNVDWTTDWNSPPTINSISLTSPAYTNTTLVCNADFSDPDYGPWNIGYTWKVNSNVVETGSTTQSSPGDVSFSLQPEKFKKGDSVLCTLVVSDSKGASDQKTASVAISNTPPSRPSNIFWSSDANMTLFNLTAEGSQDIDNDQITYEYQVYYDGNWHDTTSQWNASRISDQTIKFRARASDGESVSDWLESPNIQLDHEYLPVLLDLEILPKNPHFDDNLTANATYYDKDGDLENGSEIVWEVNGKNYTSRYLADLFSRGDNVTLFYTPCNQKQCGKTYSTSVMIQDYLPNTTLDYPKIAKGNTSYNLVVKSFDKDGDELSLACFLDGSKIMEENGTGKINKTKPIVSPANEGNHTIECQTYDGMKNTNVSLEFKVDNTPPDIQLDWPRLTNKNFMVNVSTSEPARVECKGDFLGEIDKNGTINASSCLPDNTSGNITIELEFLDLANNSKTANLTTYLDTKPPVLEVNAPTGIVLPDITIIANASDDYALDFLGYKLDNGNLTESNNVTLTERGTHNIVWIAKDKAGNIVQKNITVRINKIPRANASIPSPLYADSKLACEPVNVSNEPDQPWNYSISWLKNGKPLNLSNYSLARGDNLSCILNISDSLGEWSLANTTKTVQNKPPSVSVNWVPRYPSIGQDIKIEINVRDVDLDTVSWNASFLNNTWNETMKTVKAGDKPGNHTLEIWAWDGFNWTNESFVISHHLCGNKILEPGEECDGQAPPGFKCQECKLVKIKTSHGGGGGGSFGGGGSGGGGSVITKITPKMFVGLPFIDKLEKIFGYEIKQSTKTYWRINFTIARNMSWIRLEDKIPAGFEDVECNIGKCRIENRTLIWEAKNASSGEEVEIKLESRRELLLAEMQKELESSEKPKIVGKVASLESKPRESKTSGDGENYMNYTKTGKARIENKREESPKIPIIKEKLVAGKLDITGLLASPTGQLGLNVILSLAIILLGFKYRRNLRRLGARLYAMRTKMSPRSKKS